MLAGLGQKMPLSHLERVVATPRLADVLQEHWGGEVTAVETGPQFNFGTLQDLSGVFIWKTVGLSMEA